jgi:hypothetical protein
MNQCPHCGGGPIQTVQVGEGGAWGGEALPILQLRCANCGKQVQPTDQTQT